MNIYIYSDESGVFDKVHNDIYVFGGVVFLNKDDKDICARKYLKAERTVRNCENKPIDIEIKATTVSNRGKNKLYRALNNFSKFGVIIHEQQVLDRIFSSKKDKQRYLDYAYKIGIKRYFQNLISQNMICPDKVSNLLFYVDEHTTATNGRYELKEALEQEFKWGTYNLNYDTFFPPIFPNLKDVRVEFCNSKSKTLIRAADIVANHLYFMARKNNMSGIIDNLYYSRLP